MLTEITHISDKEKTTLRLDITDEQYKEIVEKYGAGNPTVRRHKHTKMTPKENETVFSENHIHIEIVEKTVLSLDGLIDAMKKAILYKGAFRMELVYDPEDAITKIAIYLPGESASSDNYQEA